MTVALVFGAVVLAFVVLYVLTEMFDDPPQRCGKCGRKLGADHIPRHIRDTMRAAGHPDPLWYVGQLHCPYTAASPSHLPEEGDHA